MEYLPYSYLIGWKNHNLWYYGIEYGRSTKIANPSNLWTTYFTSSREVAKLRCSLGEPDVIQVRKTFSTKDDALRWEEKVLRRLAVLKKQHWINRSYGGTKFRNSSGIDHFFYGKKRPEHGKAMSGEKNPFYGRKFVGAENPFYGKQHTKSAKDAISLKSRRTYTESMGEDVSLKKKASHSQFMMKHNPFLGKNHSTEAKEAISIAAKRRVVCPHCNTEANIANASRWHMSNCKKAK